MDWYMFALPSDGYAHLDFGKKHTTAGNGWEVQLFNYGDPAGAYIKKHKLKNAPTSPCNEYALLKKPA